MRILRIVVLSLCTILAIVVLGLAGHLLSVSHNSLRFTSNAFASLAIATSAITIVSLPVLLIIDLFQTQTGAFTPMIGIELIWLFVVWVLWLSTSADTARFNRTFFRGTCGFSDGFVKTTCQEVRTVEAFAFIIWIILMGYFTALLVYAIVGSTREEDPGTSSAKRGTPAAAPAVSQGQNQQGTATGPPMQQYQDTQGTQPGVQGPVNV